MKTVANKHSPIKKRPWSLTNMKTVCVLLHYSAECELCEASAAALWPTWYSHLHPSPASARTVIWTTPNAVWLHEVRADRETECRDVTISEPPIDCSRASFTPCYVTFHCSPPNCCCHRGGHTIVIYILVSAVYFTPAAAPSSRSPPSTAAYPVYHRASTVNVATTVKHRWWRTLLFFGTRAKTRFVCRTRLFGRMAFGYVENWIFYIEFCSETRTWNFIFKPCTIVLSVHALKSSNSRLAFTVQSFHGRRT